MFRKTIGMLSVATAFSTAFPALAALNLHRITITPRPIYNMDPGNGSCSPIHPPFAATFARGPIPVHHQIIGDA
jgi:hypothetical protein